MHFPATVTPPGGKCTRVDLDKQIPCTLCPPGTGGAWDLWYDPTGGGLLVLRHLGGQTGRNRPVFVYTFDVWRWEGEFRRDIIGVIAAIQREAHPLWKPPPRRSQRRF